MRLKYQTTAGNDKSWLLNIVVCFCSQPLSLLSSHSTCRLLLTAKKRTQQVLCQEEHIFRPFSAGYKNKSGAITKTR